MSKNIFTLEGNLYTKRTQPWKNDKGESGEFRYLILEVKDEYNYTDKKTGESKHGDNTEFPEFKLRSSLNYDDFEIGDAVKVSFVIHGKTRSWKDKTTLAKVSKHFTELEAIRIEFADVNKQKAKQQKETVFTGADETTDDNEDFKDIPF